MTNCFSGVPIRGGLPETARSNLSLGGDLSIAYISIEATKWAWNESSSTGQTKLVLLAIAAHCNADGWAWPSLKMIEEACHCSRPTVLRSLDWLEEFGEIEIARGGQGPGSTHRYFLKGFVERVKKGKEIEAKGKVEPDLRVNPLELPESSEAHEAERVTVEKWLISDSQNKNLEKERLEEADLTLPLCKEERRAIPKPVREPKVRKGFQKTLPPKREYVRPAKPSETWNRFAILYKNITDYIPVSYPEIREAMDRLLGEIGQAELEWRLSRWAEERPKRLSEWAVKDFLEGEWKLVGKEAGDIQSIVNEE